MAETQAAAAKSGASSSQPESAAPVPPVEALVGQKRKQPEGAEIQPGRVESVLLSRLECAICLTTMFPPIKQCSEGHNFCNKCANKLMTGAQASARKCPTCRTPLEKPVARARNLEQWATEADVEVTCDHDECGEKFPYSQYLEHKKTCVGCSVGCPLSKCSWRGEPQHLTAHLMEAHKLPSCPNSAKYSNRHHDYSTTVIFETKRPVGNKRRWRPPRQLVLVPPNPKIGTEGVRAATAPPPRRHRAAMRSPPARFLAATAPRITNPTVRCVLAAAIL